MQEAKHSPILAIINKVPPLKGCELKSFSFAPEFQVMQVRILLNF